MIEDVPAPSKAVHTEKPMLLALCKEKYERYSNFFDYESALFWAEKWVAISIDYRNSTSSDKFKPFSSTNWLGTYDILSYDLLQSVNSMIRCYVLSGAYARAVHFINSNKLQTKSKQFFYYLLYCQVQLKDWTSAKHSLLDYENGLIGPYLDDIGEGIDLEILLESRIEHLKAKAYEALEQRETASEYYCTAVSVDNCAVSSLRALSDRQLLSGHEVKSFLQSAVEENDSDDSKRMQPIFEREFDKYGRTKGHTVNSDLTLMTSSSFDHHLWQVVSFANNHQSAMALRLSTRLLNIEPYDPKLLQWHISLLVENENAIELFKISHRLINMDYENWHGWYAAGCYYLTIHKYEKAAELLRKSLTKEPSAGLAYLALGHAFSNEKEHDQAMSAYLTAERVMRGSALPHLYVGLEYGSTGNHDQAESFLRRAIEIEPENPLVLHELGTNAYQLGKFSRAKDYYEAAMVIIEQSKAEYESEVVSRWAPLLHNLGNCYRKLGALNKSVEYHRRAMSISPPSAEGHSLLGFSLALNGDLIGASEQFQYALSFNRHDQFTLEMLKNAMDEIAKDVSLLPTSDSDDDEISTEICNRKSSSNFTEPKSSDRVVEGAIATLGGLQSSTPNVGRSLASSVGAFLPPPAVGDSLLDSSAQNSFEDMSIDEDL